MMSSKDSMALAVGQAMLDRIAASAPELSGVGDMDGDVIPADPDMDAKTDAGFLPSITLADYLPKGVTIDANPKAKA